MKKSRKTILTAMMFAAAAGMGALSVSCGIYGPPDSVTDEPQDVYGPPVIEDFEQGVYGPPEDFGITETEDPDTETEELSETTDADSSVIETLAPTEEPEDVYGPPEMFD